MLFRSLGDVETYHGTILAPRGDQLDVSIICVFQSEGSPGGGCGNETVNPKAGANVQDLVTRLYPGQVVGTTNTLVVVGILPRHSYLVSTNQKLVWLVVRTMWIPHLVTGVAQPGHYLLR